MKLHRSTKRTNKVIAEAKDFSYNTLNSQGEECFKLNVWGSLANSEEYSLELSREEMQRLYMILSSQLSVEEKGIS